MKISDTRRIITFLAHRAHFSSYRTFRWNVTITIERLGFTSILQVDKLDGIRFPVLLFDIRLVTPNFHRDKEGERGHEREREKGRDREGPGHAVSIFVSFGISPAASLIFIRVLSSELHYRVRAR